MKNYHQDLEDAMEIASDSWRYDGPETPRLKKTTHQKQTDLDAIRDANQL